MTDRLGVASSEAPGPTTPRIEPESPCRYFRLSTATTAGVEATTSRAAFPETLRPADSVRVELGREAARSSPARSRGVVGPGASLDATPNLSVISRRNGTEAQLIIDIDAGALPVMPGTTCNVGRSAAVYFN